MNLNQPIEAALLGHMSGMHWMIAALLYGSGLRMALFGAIFGMPKMASA